MAQLEIADRQLYSAAVCVGLQAKCHKHTHRRKAKPLRTPHTHTHTRIHSGSQRHTHTHTHTNTLVVNLLVLFCKTLTGYRWNAVFSNEKRSCLLPQYH